MEQKLTPQLIQSMSILQLNTLALEGRVAEEMEKNFALEIVEPVGKERETEALPDLEAKGESDADSFKRLDRLTREYGNDDSFSGVFQGRRPATDSQDRDAKIDAMANAASRPESLAEHLLIQWGVVEVDEDVRRAGEAIIYNLENDGYLRLRLEEVADTIKPPLDMPVLEEALRRVQHLDPVGVAARDYGECLLLQLEALPGDNRIEKEIVKKHLPDLVRNRFPAIAKATGYSIGEITEAVRAMQSTLYLHPGLTVIDVEVPRITPDVIIEYSDAGGGLDVRLTRGSTPRLRVSKSALDMLKDKESTKEVREFVRNHVESASALMDAIKFRRERLLAVAERIVELQSDFFEIGAEGSEGLKDERSG